MNKRELIQAVAASTALTQRKAAAAINATFDTICGALVRGEKVTLVGFGGFEVRHRKARQGRNPQTGKTLRVKARKVPAFRAGRPLKDAVGGAG